MRKSSLVISAVISAGALAFVVPGLAAAADTDATFTVEGGSLDISAPASQPLTVSGAAGSAQKAAGDATITVTDNRQIVGGWVASAISTDFASDSLTVSADTVNYVGSTPISTGTVTPAAAGGNLAAQVPVLNATAVSGANTVYWTGTVTVTLPSDVLAGDYSGTITHSVA